MISLFLFSATSKSTQPTSVAKGPLTFPNSEVSTAVLYFGKFFTERPLIKLLMQNSINMDDIGWKKINLRWMYFFIFVAIVNEIVWRKYCPEQEYIWVNFKVWGLLPISFLFAASQVPLINKHKIK